jgi:small subunit ribosomal protein S6
MRYYETLCLINPNLADDDYKGVLDKFKNIIEKNKGVIIKVDDWGKKTLAYQVRKFDQGNYVLLEYCGDPGIISELQRDLRLDDRILKFQTVKLSDHVDPEALKHELDKSSEVASELEQTTDPSGLEEEGKKERNQGDKDAIQ